MAVAAAAATTVEEDRGSQRLRLGHELARDRGDGGPGGRLLVESLLLTGQVTMAASGG